MQILCRAKHDNVIPLEGVLVDLGERGQEQKASSLMNPPGRRWALQLPFCNEGTLRSWLKEPDTKNSLEWTHMFYEILLGLRHLHGLGIIHRDVSLLNGKNLQLTCRRGLHQCAFTHHNA